MTTVTTMRELISFWPFVDDALRAILHHWLEFPTNVGSCRRSRTGAKTGDGTKSRTNERKKKVRQRTEDVDGNMLVIILMI